MNKIKAYLIAPKYWDRETQKGTVLLFDKGEVPKWKEQNDRLYNIEITIGSEVKEEKRVFSLDNFIEVLQEINIENKLSRCTYESLFDKYGEKYE